LGQAFTGQMLQRYRLLILAHDVIMEHNAVGSCSWTQPQIGDSWHRHGHRHSCSTLRTLYMQIS